MKIKRSILPGNIVMEVDDRDSQRLSEAATVSPVALKTVAPCPALIVREREHDFVRDENANPFSKGAP